MSAYDYTYRLESVGSIITSQGFTYPLMADDDGIGRPRYELGTGVYVWDIETDGEWFNGLDAGDRNLVERIMHTLSIQKYLIK
jgi:hypothetical protein